MTRLALHIRHPEQIGRLAKEKPDLTAGGGSRASEIGRKTIRRILKTYRFDRVYIGDEFCPRRLPGPERMRAFREQAGAAGLKVTLLTPPMTDSEIFQNYSVFEILVPEDEVVVNDWGVMLLLKDKFPRLSLSLGRLLNRGMKDTRLSEEFFQCQADGRTLLEETTFDGTEFLAFAATRGIDRLERDLAPHSASPSFLEGNLAHSIYFPFGYITTGRICRIAEMKKGGAPRWLPGAPCRQDCERTAFRMIHESTRLVHHQNGNTIFYRYPVSLLDRLAQIADQQEVRLVYQGKAL